VDGDHFTEPLRLFTGTSPLLHRRVVADPQHLVDQGGDLKLDAHVHTVYSGRTSLYPLSVGDAVEAA
jgi:hypothetical protein